MKSVKGVRGSTTLRRLEWTHVPPNTKSFWHLESLKDEKKTVFLNEGRRQPLGPSSTFRPAKTHSASPGGIAKSPLRRSARQNRRSSLTEWRGEGSLGPNPTLGRLGHASPPVMTTIRFACYALDTKAFTLKPDETCVTP